MNIGNKLIKWICILLVLILTIQVIMSIFMENEVQAVSQSKKDYKKGSDMLNDYPGYSSLLDDLLEEHPNWTFTILFTDLDWDAVIKNETTALHGRSLVQNKSGEWVCSVCGDKPYDNGSWRCASAATVSYYMDPRNSLFEDYVFQFENLSWKDEKYTIDGVESIISDCDYLQGDTIEYTNTSGKKATINKSYAEVIMEAAEEAGISPYHLASRIRQEQGPGKNPSATATGTYSGYTGYYNFLNINASGNSSSTIIQNALSYAKNSKRNWDNPEKSIKGGAEFLARGYISDGQNTLYLQKYDVDNSDNSLYSNQYQQNVAAAKTEGSSIMQTYKEIDSSLSTDFNFIIPVFENMPSSRCPMPGTQSIVTQNIEITASSVVVYKSKSKSSTKLETLKKGDKVLRIEIGSEKENGYVWDKIVLSDGTKGYIVSEGIKIIDDITNCNINAVAIEPGNVRNGPGTSGTTTLTTLTVGQRVTIIEKGVYNNVDGYNWSRIMLADGTQGYIVARYLEEVSDSGEISDGSDIIKVVCNGGVKIRKEPGTNSEILGYADKGDYLTRIEKEVSNANGYVWDKVVTDSGKTGYVARGDDDENYIEPVNSTGSSSIKGNGFKTTGSKLVCEPDTKVENVLKEASDAIITNASGKELNSGNIATGYKIKYNGTTYTVVKLGDTNGDGKMTPADSTVILRAYVGLEGISNAEKSAADTNGDGKLTPADSTVILRAYVGIGNIEV